MLVAPGPAALAGAPLRVVRPRGAARAPLWRRRRPAPARAGGLRITTTLDWRHPAVAEKWVAAAALVPHRRTRPRTPGPSACPTRRGCSACAARTSGTARSRPWTTRPARSSPTSARPDYYGRRKVSKQDPAPVRRARRRLAPARLGVQALRLRDGHRRRQTLTASTMLMDVTTDFGGLHAHRLRPAGAWAACASATPSSSRSTSRPSRPWPSTARTMSSTWRSSSGMDFQRRRPQRRACRWRSARSRSTRSTSTTPTGRSPTAAVYVGRTIDPVGRPSDGEDVLPPYDRSPARRAVISPQAAYIVTDILAGNTDPAENPIWGRDAHHRRDAAGAGRRPSRRARTTTPRTSRLRLHRAARPAGSHATASTRWPWASGRATATPAP